MADERDRDFRQYLLGRLSEPASQAIEESYFADASVFERVEEAEHALIDDYLEERLSGAERDQFEQHFLATPARAKRVAIARALRETATKAVLHDHPSAVAPSTRVWLALAATIFAAVAIWFAFARPSAPPAQHAGPPQQAQPSLPPPETPPPAREAAIVALVLSPVSTRSAEPSAEIRPTDATRVEIDLLGTAPRSVGSVEIRSVDAGVVWTGQARAASAGDTRDAIAHVTVPMDRLPHGDYILTLWSGSSSSDAPPVGTYYFRVTRP